MTIKELRDTFAKAKESMKSNGKQAAIAYAKENIFDVFPWIESFSFQAWTPYFNDGDPCSYHIRSEAEYGMAINGVEWEDYDDEEIPVSRPDFENALRAVDDVVSEIGEDILEACFDEGKIEFYRNGTVDTEECYHD